MVPPPSIVRIYKNNETKSQNSISETIEHRTPIYEYDETYPRDIRIQASSNVDDAIHIKYDNLSLNILGLTNINVLDQTSAGKAIDQVKSAMQIINGKNSVYFWS